MAISTAVQDAEITKKIKAVVYHRNNFVCESINLMT